MNKRVWQEVRFSLYAAFIINAIIVQWVVDIPFRCDITGEKCFACGMRTAVDLVCQGKFSEAYASNKLIVLAFVIGLGMAIDVATVLYKRKRGIKHGKES